MRFSIKTALLLIGASALAVPSFATSIILGINGDAQVGATFINFGDYPYDNNFSGTQGTIQVSQVLAGSILANAGVQNGTWGTAADLNAASEPVNTNIVPPLQFLKFYTDNTLTTTLPDSMYLTYLYSGDQPNPPGCTGAAATVVGPFCITDSGAGSVTNMHVLGYVDDNGTDTWYTGIFSATFSGMTVADLEAEIQSTGYVQTPFSATFSLTTTPEPGSMLLLGIGLLGAGLVARRKVRG